VSREPRVTGDVSREPRITGANTEPFVRESIWPATRCLDEAFEGPGGSSTGRHDILDRTAHVDGARTG
jgi:hypothetical protein